MLMVEWDVLFPPMPTTEESIAFPLAPNEGLRSTVIKCIVIPILITEAMFAMQL